MQGDAAVPVVPVSVAVSTLDRPEALAHCLRSLAGGTALPAEVVVVDQSRQRTARAVAEAAYGLPCVQYVPQQQTGLSVGHNAAVACATSAVVAVLDDDCRADPRWVETVHIVLADERSADLVGGRVLPLADGRPGLYAVSSRTSAERRTFERRDRPWEVGSGNNFAFRRTWFDRVGGCDRRLGPGSAGRGACDIDLFYRLMRAGARAAYEPDLLVLHERATRAQRLARRIPYGFGMGAACAIWLRERDRCAWRVFGNWLLLRLQRAATSLRGRNWLGAWEEALVLVGTVRGVVYGLRATASER
jgi:GT2 family glycosyltransferase